MENGEWRIIRGELVIEINFQLRILNYLDQFRREVQFSKE